MSHPISSLQNPLNITFYQPIFPKSLIGSCIIKAFAKLIHQTRISTLFSQYAALSPHLQYFIFFLLKPELYHWQAFRPNPLIVRLRRLYHSVSSLLSLIQQQDCTVKTPRDSFNVHLSQLYISPFLAAASVPS